MLGSTMVGTRTKKGAGVATRPVCLSDLALSVRLRSWPSRRCSTDGRACRSNHRSSCPGPSVGTVYCRRDLAARLAGAKRPQLGQIPIRRWSNPGSRPLVVVVPAIGGSLSNTLSTPARTEYVSLMFQLNDEVERGCTTACPAAASACSSGSCRQRRSPPALLFLTIAFSVACWM